MKKKKAKKLNASQWIEWAKPILEAAEKHTELLSFNRYEDGIAYIDNQPSCRCGLGTCWYDTYTINIKTEEVTVRW